MIKDIREKGSFSKGTSTVLAGHRWNRTFWLGFPAILGLLWIQHSVQHVVTELLAYGAIFAWILYSVRSLSRATPSKALLTSYARIHVSMAFAAFVALGLIAVVILGAVGYLFALGLWLGLFIAARALLAWIPPTKAENDRPMSSV